MNELLTWGIPLTLITFAIAGAFAALGTTEVSPDEFWIARGCFVLAGLITVGRIVLWEFTTLRGFPIRVLLGVLIIGTSGALTIEAVRYVNRKHSRWLEAQRPPSLPSAPKRIVIDQSSNKSEIEAIQRPNLVFKEVEYLFVHSPFGGPLVEGPNTFQYNFDPEMIALVATFENEFTDSFKAIPIGGVTAQVFYKVPDKEPQKVNRGAWLNNGNVIQFAVNEFQRLIIAVHVAGHEPYIAAILKEYENPHGGLDAVAKKMNGESYQVRVRLISEQLGKVFLDKEFTLTITREPSLKANLVAV